MELEETKKNKPITIVVVPKAENFPTPLTIEQADRLLNQHGKNVLPASARTPWYNVFFRSLFHPFNLILIFLAVISGWNQDWRTMTVMLLMVIISTGLKFVQEMKSNVAAEALKTMVENYVSVLRMYHPPDDRDPNFEDVKLMDEGTVVEESICVEDIVPGDIVRLRAGDLIPGDVQVLASKDLFVNESSLTGEAIPVEKTPVSKEKEHEMINVAERHRPDWCFMGSSVVSGTSTVIVRRTGAKTVIGEMASKLNTTSGGNNFQKGIRNISFMFFALMILIVPCVFMANYFIRRDLIGALLFAVSVAVGLTPEMLPMIVNANLSKSALSLSKKKVIVKNLDSIVNIGSMTVLCTDKTGTLTQNRVVLVKHLGIDGEHSPRPLEFAFLNSHFQTGLKNLIDAAVIEYYEKLEPNERTITPKHYVKIDEVPFDFVRRRMTVILQDDDKYILVSKGALEEMVAISDFYFTREGNVIPFTSEMKEQAAALAAQLNEDGLRVVAVGFKNLDSSLGSFDVSHECNLIFSGLVGFLDPPKESAQPAVAQLLSLGLKIKVLTGDTAPVCLKVCKEIHLPVDAVVTTKEVEKCSTEEEIAELAEKGTIFAKLTPIQKSQIVGALKKKGHVVGFLGDGINDANALKQSDIGISVDDATDVAKESADIILLEKSLLILVKAVVEGRTSFINTVKYMNMAISSNFGNSISVLIGSIWLPFQPMLAIHIVVQNLLYDASQTVIPWDNVEANFIQAPRSWNIRNIVYFMLFFGPISSIFDVLTFTFCLNVYGCHSNPQGCSQEFQTSWFLSGLLTQSLIVHLIRSDKIPFIETRAGWPLIVSTVLAMILGLIIACTGLSSWFQMTTPRGVFYPFLIGTLVGYVILMHIGKILYLRWFRTWVMSEVCSYWKKGFCRYGAKCNFLHGYPKQPEQSTPKLTTTDYVNIMTKDFGEDIYPLSCYGLAGKHPNIISGDVSPEEARWEAYQAVKNGSFPTFQENVLVLRKKKDSEKQAVMKNPRRVVQDVLDGKNVSLGDPFQVQNPFGQPVQAQNLNIFGQNLGQNQNIFQPVQNQNPFVQPAQAQNSLGQAPVQEQNPFGQPPAPTQNPFGQPPAPTQNPFGQPAQSQNSFGQSPVQEQTPFGRPPSQVQNTFGQHPIQSQNAFGQHPIQSQNPLEHHAQGPFGQPGQNQNPFVQPSIPSMDSSIPNIFNQNSQNIFNQPPTASQSSANSLQFIPPGPLDFVEYFSAKNFVPSPQDLESFRLPKFQFGMIPEVPPPADLR